MIAKGRSHKENGEDRYNAILTEEKVREIKRRFKKRCPFNGGRALAKEFGVVPGAIWNVVHGVRWKHVQI